ncbi:hypothetical protein ACFL6Y_05645 [Elusimicrobiota bacterium]
MEQTREKIRLEYCCGTVALLVEACEAAILREDVSDGELVKMLKDAITATRKPLSRIAQAQIRRSILPEYQAKAKEEEGLGIAIANHYKWDGLAILETFYAALEDANFHTYNKTVDRWIKELRHDDQDCAKMPVKSSL